ncbi:MAG: phosphoesterase PA-phosphatase, partial [Clostridia bacterium]|nr:phosphoesterase PA-phosphatase [Clostridia bacterium]
MNKKTKYILPAVSFLLFIILIVLLKTVSVEKTGVGNTSIGLYGLNAAVKEFIGMNFTWYKITEITGVIALAAAGIFALLGIIELIKRKSLLKVDSEILTLGGLYILTASLYFFFENFVVNYRPYIEKGAAAVEPSFPSSHTVLALVIFGSIFMLLSKYVKSKPLLYTIKALCAALA